MPSQSVDTEEKAPKYTAGRGPFVAEVLVSAGPRKSATEYREDLTNAELCEDCAGLCFVGEHLVFWLCDGGSNAKILPRLPLREEEDQTPPVFGFSARILAQDLGNAFVEQCCHSLRLGEPVAALDLPATAFARIASAWEERLRIHLRLCETRNIPLLASFPEVIHATGETSRSVDWSTTLTGGVFSPSKRTLALINYGSSGGIIATEPRNRIEPNNHHIQLRAQFRPEQPVSVRIFANAAVQWAHYTDVKGFALMSDGLKLEEDLFGRLERLQLHDVSSLQALRTILLQDASQTEDDKAIVFGRYL